MHFVEMNQNWTSLKKLFDRIYRAILTLEKHTDLYNCTKSIQLRRKWLYAHSLIMQIQYFIFFCRTFRNILLSKQVTPCSIWCTFCNLHLKSLIDYLQYAFSVFLSQFDCEFTRADWKKRSSKFLLSKKFADNIEKT